MISIFNGRSRTLGEGSQEQVHIQISVALRDHLHAFKGSSLNVFLCIALHADQDGWAWPSVETIGSKIGRDREAVQNALKLLRGMEIDGRRILLSYQPYTAGGKFQPCRYLLFPSAAEIAHYEKQEQQTVLDLPRPENPATENPATENPATKYNHPKDEPSLSRTNVSESRAQDIPKAVDNLDALIGELQALAIYGHIDVGREAVKCERWCQGARKKFTKRLFENWLNRIEVPLSSPTPEPADPYTPGPASARAARRSNILDKIGEKYFSG